MKGGKKTANKGKLASGEAYLAIGGRNLKLGKIGRGNLANIRYWARKSIKFLGFYFSPGEERGKRMRRRRRGGPGGEGPAQGVHVLAPRPPTTRARRAGWRGGGGGVEV